ncbi:plasmid partitioning protein RepB [Methylopila sp. M107]|uniref:plasmid partitioning protein RepB n=1 Tax=Methylopila sp. M107 TaxID=1101190 RepID=UPI00039FC4EC|nr:plasmid partitioning protein RepB [Methylopila sp. M107]
MAKEPSFPITSKALSLSKKPSSNEFRVDPRVVELDPNTIDPSFIIDRLPTVDDSHLLEMIRDHGQQAPVLVRPHPDLEGRYQSAFGHRRIRIAIKLGVSVAAIVRVLTDEQLVVAQGQENAARMDLSFIERASFAQRMEMRGFSRITIMNALGVDKFALSRLISAVSKIPRDLIEAIGAAPRAGLPRWKELSERIVSPQALREARDFIATDGFQAATTDERFVQLLGHMSDTSETAEARSQIVIDDIAIGVIQPGRKTTTFRFDNAAAPAFAEHLASQIGDIFRAWNSDPQTNDDRRRPHRKS